MHGDTSGLQAYGDWVATLAPWSHFLTLTHDPRRLAEISPSWSRVGVQGHRRRVRDFFFDCVKKFDPSARWWSEMELHESGQAHEHVLLAASPTAPVLSMRQVWFERCGYCRVDEIRENSAVVAAYIAKYGGKAGAYPPFVFGFGLNSRESFATVHASLGFLKSGDRFTPRMRSSSRQPRRSRR
jgi:hypothetical protein